MIRGRSPNSRSSGTEPELPLVPPARLRLTTPLSERSLPRTGALGEAAPLSRGKRAAFASGGLVLRIAVLAPNFDR
jgi:hypothetical protein